MAGINVPGARSRISMATASFHDLGGGLRALKLEVEDAEFIMSEDAARELAQLFARRFGVMFRPADSWRPEFIRIKEE